MPTVNKVLEDCVQSFGGSVAVGGPLANETTDVEKRDQIFSEYEHTTNFVTFSDARIADVRYVAADEAKRHTPPIMLEHARPLRFDDDDSVGSQYTQNKHTEELVFDRARHKTSCKKSVLEFILDNNVEETKKVIIHNGDKVAVSVYKITGDSKWYFRECLVENAPEHEFKTLEELCNTLEHNWTAAHKAVRAEQKLPPLRLRARENVVRREKTVVFGTVDTTEKPTADTYSKAILRRITNENARWKEGSLTYRVVIKEGDDDVVSRMTDTMVY